MDGCMDNSCKRSTYCLYRSFIIIHTERGQWQTFFMREKSACLAEVSVTDRLYGNFQNSQKSWEKWACTNSVYQALSSPPTHKSLETRLALYIPSLCTHTQLNPFYHPFYPDVTHVQKDTRPSLAFLDCKRWKAGWGLETRLPLENKCTYLGELGLWTWMLGKKKKKHTAA